MAFRLKPIFCSFSFIFIIFTSIISPIFSLSAGFFTGSNDISEIWIKPSTPSSNLTIAPKLNIFVTFPFTISPTFLFLMNVSQGFGKVSFKLNEILFFSLSKFIILTFTLSPTFITSDGWFILSQDRSDI